MMDRKCRQCNYCFEGHCDLYEMDCDNAINICDEDSGLMYPENTEDDEND